MSDASRTQIAITEEATQGTTPATPVFEVLRITAANLADDKQTVVSNELRADAQITDRITTMFEPGGDLPMESSYGAIDTPLRGGMRSEWLSAPVRDNNGTADSVITAVSSTDVTVSAAPGTPTQYSSGVFAQGHLVRTSGFGDAGNNGLRVAGSGSSGTTIKLASGTVDATPAAAARAKVIGFQGASGDIVGTSTGLTSTTLDFTTLGLFAGMWLYVGGPGMGQAFAWGQGWVRVASAGIAAHVLTFDRLPSTWATDAGTALTVRCYFGDVIRNGTTVRNYTIEQQFQDLVAPTFEYYKGHIVDKFEWAFNTAAISTAKVTFMGKSVAAPATSRFSGASDKLAPTNDVINSSDNVGTMLLNGAAIPGGNIVTSFVLTISNTARRNNGIGANTSQALKQGTFNATVKFDTYYGDPTILTLVRNSTASSYFLPVIAPSGTQAYLIDAPRFKFGNGSPTVPGKDTDRMLSTDMQLLRDPTLGYTLQVQRLEEFNT